METAFFALDKDRFGTELPRCLIPGDDAADCRGYNDINLAERGRHLVSKRLAETFGADRVLEDEHLLQEDGATQARGEDEMTLQQRTGIAEFLQHLFGIHHKPPSSRPG